MISKMRPVEKDGSRIGIVFNGSPLFTGDAGSGESEIRRWIIENDWLEAIVALPEQLFYNTGIATYVWVITNRKARARKGRVQLIDARNFWVPMEKSLGNKRNELSAEHIATIATTFGEFRESAISKVFDNEDFGYRRITVERPLRLSFQASPERIALLRDEKAFAALATSKKKGAAGDKEIAEGVERIQIMDRWHDLNCAVYVLDGFSGHADHNDFAWWYEQTGGGIESAFLVHGEPESMEALAPLLQPFVRNAVVIPEKGQGFDV